MFKSLVVFISGDQWLLYHATALLSSRFPFFGKVNWNLVSLHVPQRIPHKRLPHIEHFNVYGTLNQTFCNAHRYPMIQVLFSAL